MNNKELLNYIQNPVLLNNDSFNKIKELIKAYPYFQTAYLLFAQNKKANGQNIDKEIAILSTHVADRNILYKTLNPSDIQSEISKFLAQSETQKNVVKDIEKESSTKDELVVQNLEKKEEELKPLETLTASVAKLDQELETNKTAQTDETMLSTVEVDSKEEIKAKAAEKLKAKLAAIVEKRKQDSEAKTLKEEADKAEQAAIDLKLEEERKAKLLEAKLKEEQALKTALEAKLKAEADEKALAEQKLKEEAEALSKANTETEKLVEVELETSLLEESSKPETNLTPNDDFIEFTIERSDEVEETKVELSEKLIDKKDITEKIEEKKITIDKIPKTETLADKILREVAQRKSKKDIDAESKKKANLIDKFINQSDQLNPIKAKAVDNENKAEESARDSEEFVSEKLAEIYLDQKLYSKSISAYNKLILRNPEKSTYFAAQINKIKKLKDEV